MSIPTLNRLLVLEAPQRLPDGAGGFTEVWQAIGTVWAQVALRTGRETARQDTAIAAGSFRITLRATPFDAPDRPRPQHRFRDGQRVFRINAVAETDAFGHYLTCFATEEWAA